MLVTPTPIANKFCKVVFDPYPKGRFQKLLTGFFLLRGVVFWQNDFPLWEGGTLLAEKIRYVVFESVPNTPFSNSRMFVLLSFLREADYPRG